MLTPRTIQVLFGATTLFFLITLFGHRSWNSLNPGNPSPDGSYQGLGHRITSHIKPFFNGGTSLLNDHLERSEQNYQRLIAQRPLLAKGFADGEEKRLFPADSGPNYLKTPFTIWDFAPAGFNCPHTIQRLGRLGNGGKWLCGIEKHVAIPKKPDPTAKSKCVMYTFGIQAESSFEQDVLKRASGCEVWGYDFSIDKFGPDLQKAEADGRAHFTQAAVAGKTDITKTPPFFSIQDLMQNNGHDHIDILKMDVEGFEFESMKSLIEGFANVSNGEVPVAQLLVEVHLDPGRVNNIDEFMDWWVMLEDAGFRPVWTEPNLLVSTIPLHDAKPRYAGYTFINIKDRKSILLR